MNYYTKNFPKKFVKKSCKLGQLGQKVSLPNLQTKSKVALIRSIKLLGIQSNMLFKNDKWGLLNTGFQVQF